MNAALAQIFDGPKEPHRLHQHPLPEKLNQREVLVRIDLATICGSDLHTIHGLRPAPTPCILGHEAVGRVVRAGGNRADLRPGDRVTWSIADSCGTCPPCAEYRLPEKCQSLFKYGHASLTDGAGLNGCYASHILIRPGTHIVKVPDSLSDSIVAPANCALATMVNAVSRIPTSCRTAVIQGAGLLGLYGCALLRERGVKEIFCVDVSDSRLARVAQFGGTPIVGGRERNMQAEETILRAAHSGVDAVLEVTGDPTVFAGGMRLLRPGGHYELIGMVHPQTQLDVTGEAIIRKCLTIHGTHNYAPWHLDDAIAFLEKTRGRYPYETLVSPPFDLTDFDKAFAEAGSRRWPRVSIKAEVANYSRAGAPSAGA